MAINACDVNNSLVSKNIFLIYDIFIFVSGAEGI